MTNNYKWRWAVLFSLIWATDLSIAQAPIANTPVDEPRLRDPFWPLGYMPEPDEDEDPVPVQDNTPVNTDAMKWPEVVVRGISDTPQGLIAIIDEVGVVEAGQTFNLKKGGFLFGYKIETITKKGIKYKKQEIRPARGGE